jgi:hypothetical protein
MNVVRSPRRLIALTVVITMPLIGLAGVASAAPKGSAKWCAAHAKAAKTTPACQTTTGGGGTGGTPPVTEIQVTASPDPLIETGESQIDTIIEVEAQPAFAGDTVYVSSQQLDNSCAGGVVMWENEGTVLSEYQGNSADITLDNDGNASLYLEAYDCAPGSSLLEADLVNAPYYTATTEIIVQPPNVITPGLTGFPTPYVEVGDGTLTGSNVYALFYFDDNPVYAETPVEISSAQLQNRCLGGETWGGISNDGTGTATGGETTLDNDGNAVFGFEGISCAPGTSTVVADLEGGTHDTFWFNFTITAPTPTVA